MLDGIVEIIDALAAKGRRSRSAQLRLLVDEALYLRGLIDRPELPFDSLEMIQKIQAIKEKRGENQPSDNLSQLIRKKFMELVDDTTLEPIRLQEIATANGEFPNNRECNELAEALDYPLEHIETLAKKLYKRNGNSASTQTA